MSKKLFLLPALLLGAFLVFAPACGDDDPCKDVDCGANGTCFDGGCVCDVGYETDATGKCTVKTIDKLAGTYIVSEDCSLSPADTYAVTIEAVDASTLKIVNFWNLFQNKITATIESATALKITRQEPDNDKFFVEGTGAVSVNGSGKTIITWTYKVTDETGGVVVSTDQCNNTIYTKN